MALWIVIAIVVAVTSFVAWARWFEWSHAFKPSRTMEGDPSVCDLPFEDVWFMSEDGVKLHGWWIPHPHARGTILYCHGNGGNISGRLDIARDLYRLETNLFFFDYRGYGRSRGTPGEQGLYRDARAAYEVVRARHENADRPPVVVYGGSLGGAVGVQLAAEKPVRGLILECTFTSSRELGEIWYPYLPIRHMIRYRFDSLTTIRTLPVPLLVAHSPDDDLIPYSLGKKLYDAAPGPKTFVTLAGEHDEHGWSRHPTFWDEIERFLHACLPGSPAECKGSSASPPDSR